MPRDSRVSASCSGHMSIHVPTWMCVRHVTAVAIGRVAMLPWLPAYSQTMKPAEGLAFRCLHGIGWLVLPLLADTSRLAALTDVAAEIEFLRLAFAFERDGFFSPSVSASDDCPAQPDRLLRTSARQLQQTSPHARWNAENAPCCSLRLGALRLQWPHLRRFATRKLAAFAAPPWPSRERRRGSCSKRRPHTRVEMRTPPAAFFFALALCAFVAPCLRRFTAESSLLSLLLLGPPANAARQAAATSPRVQVNARSPRLPLLRFALPSIAPWTRYRSCRFIRRCPRARRGWRLRALPPPV